jgi:hypothetical protein
MSSGLTENSDHFALKWFIKTYAKNFFFIEIPSRVLRNLFVGECRGPTAVVGASF